MALQSVGSLAGTEPWTHWNQDLFGDWRANFYTTTEPYLRRPWTIPFSGATRLKERTEEAKAHVDAKMADEGYVTFDKLPTAVQEHWAKSDANWLVDSIVRHVAERSV